MRGIFQRRARTRASLCAVVLVALVAGIGCGVPMQVRVEDAEHLARLRTWNFLPRETRNVRAASPGEAAALERRLERLIGEALTHHGFQRAFGLADFYVTYALHVHSEVVTTWETGAERYLSSLHSSPSFIVQAQRPRRVRVETAQLVISVVDPRRREIGWRGELAHRMEGAFAPELARSVGRLFTEFPMAVPGEPTVPRPPPKRMLAESQPEAPSL